MVVVEESARPSLRPARLGAADLFRLGGSGLRARPLRAVLSALGIAIGIAAMVAVVGISASSRANLDRALAQLGTNMLTVSPGNTMFGEDATLPDEALPMIERIGPVTAATAVGKVPDTSIYRTDRIPSGETGGLALLAAQLDLLKTVGATLAEGAWLNAATAKYPAVVLGSAAARRLGDVPSVYIDGRWYRVLGVLNSVPLASELDNAVLIGWDAAKSYLRFDGHATTVYTRSVESQVEAVRAVLAATANPENPDEVQVSNPSDALLPKRAANQTFNALLLGLGAVALLVGGIGVANTMVISVLERRAEIGLRRSLGATRGQIRTQFVAESLLLSLLGGLGGVLGGIVVTAGYATSQDWPVAVPLWVTAGGIGATLVIGAIAGLYPAIRAARLAPTEALAAA
ncbi:putative ABC transport system permease protein [Actinoplanes octamycinicus]|uniref:Putative ABC transport system permease protein n=1 Tax=Actinoplanes octamycinicus TaxID=135948 RepID=A0A7W7M721_9ACTN|nr:ABC transporter permease [Actinoplanes octamycinicus]MBB4739353.1 putative ABC transport system permease protein [Actinoplanes octamycinicus]GIE58671.1 ABC transporter permease [Actinoplanes octamycinicus]